MNAVVELKQGALAQSQGSGRMAVADIIQHVSNVQEVMKAVMKEGVHYGKIPGAGDKMTLLKPGAEVLCMAFRVADTYVVEDLSTPDMIRYRVNCIGTHQASETMLGSGLGEASSNEEKYKWRRAVCQEEFEDTPVNLRRKKYAKQKGGGFYRQDQVRTEPADLANTVLKMANKRAKVAMTINVTACGDMFNQDLEDMEETLREHIARHEEQPEQPTAPPVWPDAAFANKLPTFRNAIASGKSADDIISWAETKGALTEAQKAAIRAPIAKPANDAPVQDAAPKVTYAAVADRLTKAASLDALAEAADLIGAVADEAQRAELVALHDNRRAALA